MMLNQSVHHAITCCANKYSSESTVVAGEISCKPEPEPGDPALPSAPDAVDGVFGDLSSTQSSRNGSKPRPGVGFFDRRLAPRIRYH
jgi:hypothetical protein